VLAALANPSMAPPGAADIANAEAWRRAEIPAANGHGNARSVARIMALLACGGRLDGVELLKERTIAQAIEEQSYAEDLVLGFRMRMILTEDRPAIQGYDQDRWAGTLRYPELPLDEARAQLRALRAANLRVLRRLGPAEMERVGMHSERGPESLGHLIKLMGPHDLVHRRQIDRILNAGKT